MKFLYIIFAFLISFLSFSNTTIITEERPKRFYRHKHYLSTQIFHNYKNNRNSISEQLED
jgi:hypothetical protein